MNKLRYLFSISIKRALRGIKTNKALFLSFYIGMFLPLISMGNISFLRDDYDVLQFEEMERSQRITWSSELLTEQQREDFMSSLQGQCLELQISNQFRFSEPNNTTIPVIAISDFGNENETNKNQCLVGKDAAKRYGLSAGITLKINDISCFVSEISNEERYSNYVVVSFELFEELIHSESSIQQSMIVERIAVEDAYEQGQIMRWFQENDIVAEHLEVINAGDYYRMVLDGAKPWVIARIVVGTCGGLFALVNIVVILVGKLQEQKKTYGIMLALGGEYFDLSFGFLIENFLIAFVADLLLLITFPYILKVADMDQMIMVDTKVIIGLLSTTLMMVLIINLILLHYLKKIPIIKSIQGDY